MAAQQAIGVSCLIKADVFMLTLLFAHAFLLYDHELNVDSSIMISSRSNLIQRRTVVRSVRKSY